MLFKIIMNFLSLFCNFDCVHPIVNHIDETGPARGDERRIDFRH